MGDAAQERTAASGQDRLLDPAQLDAALPGLAASGDLIVAEAAGELSLSALIAAVSGQADLGGQDDSVLELGFRRLTGADRTVLVLRAPAGVSRSALRYVQHIARVAPNLVLVALASSQLHALLGEPGFAALRTRLHAAPPPEPAAPPSPRPVVPPAAEPTLERVTAPANPPHRRRTAWAAAAALCAASAAAAAIVIPTSPAASGNREMAAAPIVSAPIVAASVPASLPGTISAPSPAAPHTPVPVPDDATPAPRLATIATPDLLAPAPLPPAMPPASGGATEPSPARVAAAAAPAVAPAVAVPAAVAVLATLPPLLPRAGHAVPLRHAEPPRLAHARPALRAQEPARFADDRYPEPPPYWDRPERRRREMPYIGTYAADPYGYRVFSYDP